MTDSLLTPLSLRETEVRNRIMVSPMCQYFSIDGFADSWHLVHLGSRAVGGTGIVMSEATAVSPGGRITPNDLGTWSDDHVEKLSQIISFVSSMRSTPAVQLAHVGQRVSKTRPWEGSESIAPGDGGWTTVAPSDAPWPYEGEAPPTRKLSADGTEGVVDDFRMVAERALDADFEIVEVHAAHGYLLHEFLSPVTDHRDDEYGSSLENRTRLLREVTDAVRGVWPDDKPVFVRISATDWLDDRESWDIEQSTRLAADLDDLGVDLVDANAGGIHPDQRIPNTGSGYQIPFAEVIHEETDAMVGMVGGIRAACHADEVVRNGRAGLTIVGREHSYDPYFVLHAADDLDADAE